MSKENYVLFKCSDMLIPADRVAALFELLNEGRPVDYNWSDKVYSFRKDMHNSDVSARPFPTKLVVEMEARAALDD